MPARYTPVVWMLVTAGAGVLMQRHGQILGTLESIGLGLGVLLSLAPLWMTARRHDQSIEGLLQRLGVEWLPRNVYPAKPWQERRAADLDPVELEAALRSAMRSGRSASSGINYSRRLAALLRDESSVRQHPAIAVAAVTLLSEVPTLPNLGALLRLAESRPPAMVAVRLAEVLPSMQHGVVAAHHRAHLLRPACAAGYLASRLVRRVAAQPDAAAARNLLRPATCDERDPPVQPR